MSGGSGISPEVAEHVRGIAQALGYEPNMHARGLAGGSCPPSDSSCTRSATPTSPTSPAA
ncbi:MULTISPECIES: hypothetical protein [unclassified Microbacterium]|uniref:hypothetical protein n=1 Tax=unclassified Microbacterium TaxID=2609290 RepID=UPI001FCE9C8B|nr:MULTISPECIES: hypothetical protein [unclassified Microbacterium]